MSRRGCQGPLEHYRAKPPPPFAGYPAQSPEMHRERLQRRVLGLADQTMTLLRDGLARCAWFPSAQRSGQFFPTLRRCLILVLLSGYDFRGLSAYDFEALARDLLSRALSIDLEIFSPGRDEGIDLRYMAADADAATIVQCKHYATSSFSTFKNRIATELPKIRAIDPKRYCLVTSLRLTPARKDVLVALLAPYVRTTGDIWGQEDLNALLRQYPEIEKSHFKLWLTSTAVLEAVLNRDVLGRSTDLLEDIERKIKLYVPNASFPDAKRKLDEFNVAVISGEPGRQDDAR